MALGQQAIVQEKQQRAPGPLGPHTTGAMQQSQPGRSGCNFQASNARLAAAPVRPRIPNGAAHPAHRLVLALKRALPVRQ